MTVKVSVRGLCKEYPGPHGPVRALDGLTFQVAAGEFLVLVGPSGCGKSTLLRILAGLDTPTAGEVEIRRDDPQRPLTAMVFQERALLPWLTVRDNIGYPLYLRGVPPARRQAVVDHYLRVTGLTAFADAYPHQLSGGMKQRVSVARALAADPEVLLMDEPFASLDEQTKLLLQEELLRLWEGSGRTVVYVTHSIEEALTLGDRILVLTARPGRVKAEIPVNLPRPRVLEEVRTSPDFLRLFQLVWRVLRQEALRAHREEERRHAPGRQEVPFRGA